MVGTYKNHAEFGYEINDMRLCLNVSNLKGNSLKVNFPLEFSITTSILAQFYSSSFKCKLDFVVQMISRVFAHII
jgi:hypothetical protein